MIPICDRTYWENVRKISSPLHVLFCIFLGRAPVKKYMSNIVIPIQQKMSISFDLGMKNESQCKSNEQTMFFKKYLSEKFKSIKKLTSLASFEISLTA